MGVSQGGSMLVTSQWPHHQLCNIYKLNQQFGTSTGRENRRYTQPWHGDDHGTFEKHSRVTMTMSAYDTATIWQHIRLHHWEYQLCVVLTFQLIVIGRKLYIGWPNLWAAERYWVRSVARYRFLSKQEWLITFLALLLFDIWKFQFLAFLCGTL